MSNPTTIANPSLLLGLGRFGAEVVNAVQHEGGRLRDLLGNRGLDNLRCVTATPTGGPDDAPPPSELRQRLHDALRELLRLRHLIANRPTEHQGPPRLDLFVVADLGEHYTRDQLLPVLLLVHELIKLAFAPIFKNWREGENANFALIPLLATPHPPGHPDGADIRALLIELERRHHAHDPALELLRHAYLVEDVSGRYVLDRADLVEMFSTFLNFLLYSNLRSEPEIRPLYLPARPGDLYATFTCATLEFPQHAVLDWAADRLTAELLDRLASPGPQLPVAEQDRICARFDDLARPADALKRARAATREAMERARPEVFAPFPFIRELDEPRDLLPLLTDDFLKERLDPWREPDTAWGSADLDAIADALNRQCAEEFDARLAELRRLTDAILVGRELRANPIELAALLDRLRGRLHALRAPLEEALADDSTPGWPDLSGLESLYSGLLEDLRKLPSPRTLMALSGLAALAVTLLAIGGVATLPVFGLGVVLLGAAGTLLVGAGGWLGREGWRWWQTIQRVRTFTGGSQPGSLIHAWNAALAEGPDSVLSHLTTRLHRRTLQTRLDALQRAAEAVEADAQLLQQRCASLAAEQQRAKERREAARPALHAGGEGQGGLFRRSILSAADLEVLYAARLPSKDVEALTTALRLERGLYDGWRERDPFAPPDALIALAREHVAGQLSGEHAFQLPELAGRLHERINAFFTDFAATLDFHLDFSGYEAADPDGVIIRAHRLALVGESGYGLVRDARDAAGAAHWDIRSKMVDPNRVHLLRVAADIHSNAIRSLRADLVAAPAPLPPPDPAEPDEADDPQIVKLHTQRP